MPGTILAGHSITCYDEDGTKTTKTYNPRSNGYQITKERVTSKPTTYFSLEKMSWVTENELDRIPKERST